MRPFTYVRPVTLSEASALLEEHGPAASVLAGGTDLLVALRNGAIAPQVVVDVKHIAEFAPDIGMNGSRLRISATTVMVDVERDERVRATFPALADAAATVFPNFSHASGLLPLIIRIFPTRSTKTAFSAPGFI